MTIPFDYDQADWGSTEIYADGTKTPWDPDKIVIHWGGGTNTPAADPGWEMDRLRRWQNFHINNRGWTDIAYNYAVGQSGSIYRLRGQNRSGATSGDADDDDIPENHEALAFVWIGGSGTEDGPTDEAYAAMSKIINASGQGVVIGHMDVKPGSTSCPGPDWMNYIEKKGWEMPEQFDNPSPWAVASWEKAQALAYVNEHSDPHAPMKKEDFFTFIDRMGLLPDGGDPQNPGGQDPQNHILLAWI